MSDTHEIQWQDVEQILVGQQTGHVLVNQYVVHIGAMEGGAVNFATPGKRASDQIRPHRQPPRILPRTVPGFLDRNREQGLVGQALARGQVVDIHGPDGCGKTALAGQTMQAQLPSAFPGGTVYLSARDRTQEDLLQDLFGTFFESDSAVKVTANDLRRHMAGQRALIALDDVDGLQESDAGDLCQVLPQCALLVAGRQQRTWQGIGISLRGLPRQHAVQLFERHYGPLDNGDQPAVEAICEALGRIPLHIVRVATAAADDHLAPADVLARIQAGEEEETDPVATLLRWLAGQLTAGARRVLGGLAAPGGQTVGLDALPVITGLPLPEVTRHLASLHQLGLVQADDGRYTLDGGLRPHIRQAWTTDGMQARTADYYLGRAPALQGLRQDPDEGNVLAALDYFFGEGSWQQVVNMVRAMDRYLAATGRWGQWSARLEQALHAARQLGDQATEAWALNQLGVIALGLGEKAAAIHHFRDALSLRRALGDRAGATVSRWHLRLITLSASAAAQPGGQTARHHHLRVADDQLLAPGGPAHPGPRDGDRRHRGSGLLAASHAAAPGASPHALARHDLAGRHPHAHLHAQPTARRAHRYPGAGRQRDAQRPGMAVEWLWRDGRAWNTTHHPGPRQHRRPPRHLPGRSAGPPQRAP